MENFYRNFVEINGSIHGEMLPCETMFEIVRGIAFSSSLNPFDLENIVIEEVNVPAFLFEIE